MGKYLEMLVQHADEKQNKPAEGNKMSEMATVFGKQSQTITKVERYGWTVKDSPGEMMRLSKHLLRVHPAYQRHAIDSKVKMIASAWSWLACGTIIIGKRGGEYWVIDGQHRVMAAKSRSDIDCLPCLVFETGGVEQEARGFLDANTGRKPVSSIDKFRASIAAGDEVAIYVDSVFRRLGVVPRSTATRAMEIKSVAWAMTRANENRDAFASVMELAAELCREITLHEMLLDGLYYIHTNSGISINNTRLRDRLKRVGAVKLIESAKRASAYYARGGARIWAEGMLSEINKGLRDKIVLKGLNT